MKKITRITTQKKNKERYNIFLAASDGKEYFAFSVDEAIIINFNLRKGLELAESTIETLIEKDSIQKAYTMAIHFLSYRMRTKKEVQQYLQKKEVEDEHITEIMDRLLTEGLLNDREFADAFVRTRIQTSLKGPVVIKNELIEKGVAVEIADAALEQYTYAIQYDKASKLAEKKLRTTKQISFRKQQLQLQSTLLQKGFSQVVAKEVLTNISDHKDVDAEWEALRYQGEKLLRKHEQKWAGFQLKNKLKEGLFRKGYSMEMINKFIDEAFE